MTKPRDPEVIRRALIEAAVASYTSGGAFSVRDVAGRAEVNQGQIHHLFGGKVGLKRAMLETLGREQLERLIADAPQTSTEVLAAAARALIADEGRFARALARSLLEAPDGKVEQEEFPVVQRLLTTVESLPPRARPAALAQLAEGLATALGWALFSPWIRKAAELDDAVVEEVHTRLGAPEGFES